MVPEQKQIGSRRIAVLRLHLPDGQILHRQVLQLSSDNEVLDYEPLGSELPFCEWHRGDWYL